MAKYILLAEDDPDDQCLFKDALRDLYSEYRIKVAVDGQMLLDVLEHGVKRPPDIIVSDINMPRINGLDCVKAIRANSRFKHIPIVMLSTSKDEQLKKEAYSLGANLFVSKPASFFELKDIVKVIVSMEWDKATKQAM